VTPLRSSPVPLKKPERPLIKPGTKVLATELMLRDRRPPLSETAHVADSQRSFGLAVQKQALAHDSQRRRSRPPFGLAKESSRAWCGALFGFAQPENTVMRNPIDIDSSHSRAIVQEIGERLRLSFKEDREIPASFRIQIERLRQLEDETQR
jgi:hypothetical protein